MKLKEKIEYKLFKIWKNRKYKKFLKDENWEFDHSSITSFLDLKLTIMGLYFAKFGNVVDEDRKKQVHTIWQARKYLRNYLNAFEWSEEQCQKKFREKYNCDYKFEMVSTPRDKLTSYIDFKCTSQVEDKEEAEKYWNSLKDWELEDQREREQLKKAFDYIHEHIGSWWD